VEGETYVAVYQPPAGPAEQLGTFPGIRDARIAIICDKRYISGSRWQDSAGRLVTTMPDGSRFTVTKASQEEPAALKTKPPRVNPPMHRGPRPGGPRPGGPSAGGGGVIEVTEQAWDSDVIQRSHTVPVIVYWWARWSEPCKQLGPVLEKLAAEADGQWILAKMDIDANPAVGAVLAGLEIPLMAAWVGGQPVDGFQTAPEAEIRQWLSQVTGIAAHQDSPVNGESAEPPAGRLDGHPVLPTAQGQPGPAAGATSLEVCLGSLTG
jgi:thiol-disulfide isomerase/thioredoxin